jgi:drug/metabolite transporter (DMT)-like permease
MPPTGLFLGLGAALSWGLTDVAGALGGRIVGSLRVLVGSQVIGGAVLLAICVAGLLSGAPAPALAVGWVATALTCGVLATIAYLAFFTALRIGPISIVSPTVAAYGGVTVVLAVLLRGETLSTVEIAGAIVATIGVMAVGFVVPDGGRLPTVRGPGVAFALVSLVAFAVLTVTLAGPIRDVGWLPAMAMSRTSNTALGVLLLVIAVAARPRLLDPFVAVSESGPRDLAIRYIILAGLLDVTGLVFFAVGLEIAPVWLIGLSSSLGPIVAVAYAVTRLGERPRPIQWVGLVAIASGILLVGLP